jgi:hypothetical protein
VVVDEEDSQVRRLRAAAAGFALHAVTVPQRGPARTGEIAGLLPC